MMTNKINIKYPFYKERKFKADTSFNYPEKYFLLTTWRHIGAARTWKSFSRLTLKHNSNVSPADTDRLSNERHPHEHVQTID